MKRLVPMKMIRWILKTNWRSILLFGWMIWITCILLGIRHSELHTFQPDLTVGNIGIIPSKIESTADNIESDETGVDPATISGLEADLRTIKSDIRVIKSDVHKLENEVTLRYGRTLRASVEKIEDHLEKSR